MKKIKTLTHEDVKKEYYAKNPRLKQKVEAGVQRLKVILQIIELRENLGITQSEVAKRMGVSQAFIAKIENDEASNLSLETLVKIASALDSDIEIRIRPSSPKAA